MRKAILLYLIGLSVALAEPAEEWEAFQKSGLFSQAGALWMVPDMENESVPAFAARLLDGARQGDAKAMATLGRFFFVRNDFERAGEWLGKAAVAGHPGAQLDFGTLLGRGQGMPQDLVESYKWLWLATWADAPGAEAALRELSPKLGMSQVLAGLRRAAAFHDAQRSAPNGPQR
jgi:TPR repeat protein